MALRDLILNLQYFADGGAAAGGDGGAGSGETNGTGANVPDTTSAAAKKRGRVNPLADVKYGIQDDDGPEEQTDAPEETDNNETEDDTPAAESFEDLIKGRYKQDFDNRVQSIINQRFKGYKELQGNADKYGQIMTILADRYGKKADDISGVFDALSNDDSLYEEKAMERGMTAEQYRELAKVMNENRRLKDQQEKAEMQRRSNEILNGWRSEAEQLKAVYPSVSFDEELQNPNVVKLLQSGIPFRTAYEVAHKDEIMQGTIAYAVQRTKENVTNNIKARSSRPVENGMRNHAAGNVKSDVSKLTKADRDEIARRAASGVRIRFS